ncbi:hypothetical protein Droror1_Dr00013227 [Drosera rotundifolia]
MCSPAKLVPQRDVYSQTVGLVGDDLEALAKGKEKHGGARATGDAARGRPWIVREDPVAVVAGRGRCDDGDGGRRNSGGATIGPAQFVWGPACPAQFGPRRFGTGIVGLVNVGSSQRVMAQVDFGQNENILNLRPYFNHNSFV